MKILLISLSILISNSSFSSSYSNFQQACNKDSNLKNKLEHVLGVKSCDLIVNKISKLKSFSEFIYPDRRESQKRAILSAPWTDDFPELYGLNKRLLNNQFLTDPLNTSGDRKSFYDLNIFKEFTNLTDISFLPEYSYYKNSSNICNILKDFPAIKTVTTLKRTLEDSNSDLCLSLLKNGVIIRDQFKGLKRKSVKSKIIGIEYFSGQLEDLTNLKGLRYLGISKQTDALKGIESIYKHNELTHLSINIQTEVPDLEKIIFLRGVQYLNISCSPIENLNISSTEKCNSNSTIKDIHFISEMTFLKHLNLSNNKIKDISSLDSLIDLNYLNLKGNEIVFLPNLFNLKKLDFLDISKNRLTDLKNIRQLSSLVLLNASDNNISSIDELNNHESLRFLNLANNPNLSIGNSKTELPRLEVLNLNQGIYTDPVGDHRMKLFQLNEFDNERFFVFETLFTNSTIENSTSNRCNRTNSQITNISSKNFPSLKLLSIRRNGLTSSPATNTLKNLKYIDLGENEIVDMNPNAFSKSLEYIHMDSNIVETYPLLFGFKNLKAISLSSNFIDDLSNFSSSPISLNQIELSANLITDIKPIDEIVRFDSRPRLDVALSYNYIEKNDCDTFPRKHTKSCNAFNNWARKGLGQQFEPIENEQRASMKPWIRSNRCI